MKTPLILGITLFSIATISYSCDDNEHVAKSENQKDTTVVDVQPEVNYVELGKELAMQTKGNLGKNLGLALSEKGAAGAVEFCNTRAIPITDSMSVVLNTKIKRVSDKPRNPNNQANADELAYIESWKEAKTRGEQVAPLVAERNGKMVGYYPIETNAMCLQCHGTPEKQITTETLSKIKKLYPADKAVGYGENEIRGIFVVEMDKK
jgi:hypothetical protein